MRRERRRPAVTLGARAGERGSCLYKPVRWIGLAVLSAAVGLCGCRTASQGPEAAVAEYLEAAHHAWGFSGAVLVARRDKVLYMGGFGFADAASGRPVTASTRFSIGSATKPFTAAAILQLRDAGLLDLDDPLTDYVPEYAPPGSAGVTLRRLLSHSAGVPDIGLDPQALGDLIQPRAPLDLLAPIKNRPLDFTPGDSARYSNAGYALLGLVIERVARMSYADFVRERLFEPLGMGRTTYGRGDAADGDVADGLFEAPDGRFRAAPRFHPSLGFSAGGIFSTVEDLGRWDQALEEGRVLSASSRAEMFAAGKGDFGLGWLILKTWGRKDIAHGGGAPGYGAWIERWPEDGVFVAVLSNLGGAPVGEIGRSLAAILFRQEVQAPAARNAVAQAGGAGGEVAGPYRLDDGSPRDVLREGDRFFLRPDGGPKYPILPGGRDLFFFPNDKGATLRFTRDRTGRVTGYVLHQLGVDRRAEKVQALGER